MDTQLATGIFMVVVGFLAYLSAAEIRASLPGQLMFFSGVMTLTWGTENELFKLLFSLAAAFNIFIVVWVGFLIARSRSAHKTRQREIEDTKKGLV